MGEACGSGNISPNLEWSVSFPPVAKPPVAQYVVPEVKVSTTSYYHPTRISEIRTSITPHFAHFQSGGKPTPTLKVLQISDTHWDPWYEPGANAECNEPLCCRISSGPPPPPQARKGAGIWGDYRYADSAHSIFCRTHISLVCWHTFVENVTRQETQSSRCWPTSEMLILISIT